MRRLALTLPALALLLNCDQLLPRPAAPPLYAPEDLEQAFAALPARTEGRLGRAGDPLNLLFLGSAAEVSRALERAGWHPVPLDIAASCRLGLSELWRGRTLASFPPMQGYRVMERTQDMNWAWVIKPIETRHHFRLWRTGIRDSKGRDLWWGSGNFDLSMRWIDLSHRPHPDMNLERDYVAGTLMESPLVEEARLIALPQIPREGLNDNRYRFTSDGKALLVALRPSTD